MTCSTVNFLVVLITPVAFANIGYQTYIIFAVLNAAILISTYFIFPETAGRSLEEMSYIFEQASVYNPYDVVRIEKRTPRRYDKQGRLLHDRSGLENGMSSETSDTDRARTSRDAEKQKDHFGGVDARTVSTPESQGT